MRRMAVRQDENRARSRRFHTQAGSRCIQAGGVVEYWSAAVWQSLWKPDEGQNELLQKNVSEGTRERLLGFDSGGVQRNGVERSEEIPGQLEVLGNLSQTVYFANIFVVPTVGHTKFCRRKNDAWKDDNRGTNALFLRLIWLSHQLPCVEITDVSDWVDSTNCGSTTE